MIVTFFFVIGLTFFNLKNRQYFLSFITLALRENLKARVQLVYCHLTCIMFQSSFTFNIDYLISSCGMVKYVNSLQFCIVLCCSVQIRFMGPLRSHKNVASFPSSFGFPIPGHSRPQYTNLFCTEGPAL